MFGVQFNWVSGQQAARRHYVAVLGCFLAVGGGYRVCGAATFTWTGASLAIPQANDWGNVLNWQGFQFPVNDGTADVVMPDTARDNPNVDVPWSIHSLTFQGAGNSA